MSKEKLEIEIDEKTASDVEALETLYLAFERAMNNGDAEKATEIIMKSRAVSRRNPKAWQILKMKGRPGSEQNPTQQ